MMIVRWLGAVFEQGKVGSDSLGADGVSQNATNGGELEPCVRRGAGFTAKRRGRRSYFCWQDRRETLASAVM